MGRKHGGFESNILRSIEKAIVIICSAFISCFLYSIIVIQWKYLSKKLKLFKLRPVHWIQLTIIFQFQIIMNQFPNVETSRYGYLYQQRCNNSCVSLVFCSIYCNSSAKWLIVTIVICCSKYLHSKESVGALGRQSYAQDVCPAAELIIRMFRALLLRITIRFLESFYATIAQ